MNLVSQTEKISTIGGSQRLVLNLMSRAGRAIEVRSCEVIGAHHRNRFTFPNRVGVEDVFVDLIAHGINQCLTALSDTTEVVSLPSVALEVPGLTLSRVNLITTKSDDGSMGIILRFKMLLGGIARAFRPELGIEDSVQDHASHMSALVLNDIVLPLLDLCELVQSESEQGNENFNAAMDRLIERSADVRFQAELIKRYVAFSGTPAARPRLNNPHRPAMELLQQV